MLEILYQDEWLVAVNKPSGWLVHRSWLDRDEKVVVMQTVRDQIGQHVFTAHRLDRPTSGVLLMGLSSEAGRRLAQQFEQHQIHKRYHAIVRGWLMEEAVLDYPPPVKCPWQPGVIRRLVTDWWNWIRKRDASISSDVIWRTCAIRLLATASMAICGRTAVQRNILAATD